MGPARTTDKALRVACVGHASLDEVFEIDRFPAEPTKTLARRFSARPGGMSLHAAIACARLGAQSRLLARVGDDDAAAFLCRRLAEEGVQSEGVQRVRGGSTSRAAVIVDADGARQIFIHRGSALAHAPALDTRQLAGADLVLADPRWPDGAAAALAWARDHGVPGLLDADVAPIEVLQRLVPLARWVAFSEPGLDLWACGVPRDLALARVVTQGPTLSLVTLGPLGARWAAAGDATIHAAAAPAVEARDTTGAGDVFHAALGLALAEGRPASDAVAWACAAAAFKCERGGGGEGAPTRAQLETWRAQRRAR